jgi:hypothetical protein
LNEISARSKQARLTKLTIQDGKSCLRFEYPDRSWAVVQDSPNGTEFEFNFPD